MDKLSNKILKTIRDNGLISGGETVIVGLSGGADSVCLLYVLKKLERLLKIRLKAVHINHCLRGENALRDEDFSRKFCESLGVEFEAVRLDVKAYANEHKLSQEEAGRLLRYKTLSEKAAPKALIATAHHADDHAETVLLNILRGSGLRGLSGISYRRDNIIRPLLDIKKSEITDYAEKNGISYVTDETNFENDYTRNKIRNEIMPVLEREINSEAALHLNELAETACEADSFIRRAAKEAVLANAELGESYFKLPHNFLRDKERIFRIYVIMECIKSSGIGLKDWSRTHFEEIDRALFERRGYELSLPGGVKLKNGYKESRVYKE